MRRLTLAAALLLACTAQADDQVRSVSPFTSMNVQGAINVEVKAGAAQSLTVRGDDDFVNGLVSEVVNGELRVHMRDKRFKTTRHEQRIIVTVPALQAFSAEGAGEIRLDNIRGERFDVDYRGAGSMRLAGEVRSFRMKAEGVGEVNAKALVADKVDVRFKGIGDVQVHARQELDAVVQGMGSLTYFGKPPVVNKSASGLGSVKAGN